jgi:hypothetical protein
MVLIEACRDNWPASLSEPDRAAMDQYLLDLASGALGVPKRGRGYDWRRVARDAGVAEPIGGETRAHIRAVLDAYASPARGRSPQVKPRTRVVGPKREKRRSGRTAQPIVAFPEPVPGPWKDVPGFSAALDLHMRRHGDTAYGLQKALLLRGGRVSVSTLALWRRGAKSPQDAASLKLFALLEERYRLEPGYFAAKRQREPRATRRPKLKAVSSPEMRRLAWHLPDDFDERPAAERAEILSWVRSVIIAGTTDYRRFQAEAIKQRYGLQFTCAGPALRGRTSLEQGRALPTSRRPGARLAPPGLDEEMRALVRFKTDVLTAPGLRRSGVWGAPAADQRAEHFGLMFGAMAASPHGPVRGLGAPLERLTLALLAFPAVWDWYVQWRHDRRGFYTRWEVDLLSTGVSLLREGTGWLRQTPSIVDRLEPIPGLVTDADVARARRDWAEVCQEGHAHGVARMKEIERVARVHRDPFEPILVVLEAERPLAEYRKITDEILRRMPDARRHPKAAAEAVRAFLMLRIGLHTGLRQRNLRELMLCPRGSTPRPERWLEQHRRGELRWDERASAWEVYIPSVAFKNSGSSFFGKRPFRLHLPDLSSLREQIDAYVERHRPLLLGGCSDPGTFFVKSVKATSRTASYNQTTFYEAWRLTIQRYGIFNPYTGRGAIPGLLPHGPHNVRDVLATHILKQTGSYEQASYAIQDTPDMVAQHYGRFLPQDKATLAAKVLNVVWDEA